MRARAFSARCAAAHLFQSQKRPEPRCSCIQRKRAPRTENAVDSAMCALQNIQSEVSQNERAPVDASMAARIQSFVVNMLAMILEVLNAITEFTELKSAKLERLQN